MSFGAEEFQAWLQNIVKDVGRLSLEQTEEFISKFLEKCSIEQKCNIERFVRQSMSYDFISGLPELPVECILQYLDFTSLLTCRQICRTWNAIITSKSQLWWRLCLRMGGRLESFNAERSTDYFYMFMQLMRVLHKMDSDSCFEKHAVEQSDSEEKIQILQCENDMLAYGTSHRRVVYTHVDSLDDEGEAAVWRGSTPSCMALADNYVIIGTFFGEVRLWSPHNPDRQIQELTGHSNVVTSIGIHSSQRYVLTAAAGDLTGVLLHSPFERGVWRITMSPPASSFTDHVFYISFLPDPGPGLIQFVTATCVCLGLITVSTEKEFTVVDQKYTGPVMKYLSVASVKSDPTILFYTAYEGTSDKPGPCVTKRLFVRDYNFVEETLVHHSNKYRQDYRILAAGKRFLLIVNHKGDFQLFDTVQADYICHFHCKPALMSLVGLPSLLKTSCFVNTDCLDGLCPESMQPGRKVMLMASDPGIVTWQWSKDLWKDFWHGGENVMCL